MTNMKPIKLKNLLGEAIDLEQFGIYVDHHAGKYDLICIPESFLKQLRDMLTAKKLRSCLYKGHPDASSGMKVIVSSTDPTQSTIHLYVSKEYSNSVLLAIREMVTAATDTK